MYNSHVSSRSPVPASLNFKALQLKRILPGLKAQPSMLAWIQVTRWGRNGQESDHWFHRHFYLFLGQSEPNLPPSPGMPILWHLSFASHIDTEKFVILVPTKDYCLAPNIIETVFFVTIFIFVGPIKIDFAFVVLRVCYLAPNLVSKGDPTIYGNVFRM